MISNKNNRVPVTGYVNRLSARPGETLEFKLSVEPPPEPNRPQLAKDERYPPSNPYESTLSTWLTHCICADPNPDGPGIIERSADQWYARESHQAKQQAIRAGSYGLCTTQVEFKDSDAITLTARIWPTLTKDSNQCILSMGALSLCISQENKLQCQLHNQALQSKQAIKLRQWIEVSASLQIIDGQLVMILKWQSIGNSSETDNGEVCQLTLNDINLHNTFESSQSIVVAAQQLGEHIEHCFNGKIEAPSVTIKYRGEQYRRDIAWDFSERMSSCTVPGLHEPTDELSLINYPSRAMTGSTWKGQEMSWRHAPQLYGAIHFHEDDLVDVGWDTTFSWQIPEFMPSGVYVLHISDGANEDAIPFFVCSPKDKPAHRVCVLIPTFTYVIYGNHARPDYEPSWQQKMSEVGAYPHNPAVYIGYGLSTYNNHSDGSGVCHASHRRPLFNLRPGYMTFGNTECSGLRHFQADSHLLAWLDAHNIGFDVVTDHELNDEGVSCIERYDILMTTSHPEYHTNDTLDALTAYRDNGGHLSYLGGNGFYWRIALHPENTNTLEIRRAEDGIRAWAAEPGEYYQAFDGQYGGLWRRNGRPPQALSGLGFTAQGQFTGSYYRRRQIDKSLEWIFEGIDDEIIGDFGLCGGGAAGYELDRADTRLGTPEQAQVIASSENHDEDFILVPEEMLTHITTLPGPQAEELLRADIIWCEFDGGGSIFSVGSITFCGALPHNNFDNSISRLLLNVLKHVSPQSIL